MIKLASSDSSDDNKITIVISIPTSFNWYLIGTFINVSKKKKIKMKLSDGYVKSVLV